MREELETSSGYIWRELARRMHTKDGQIALAAADIVSLLYTDMYEYGGMEPPAVHRARVAAIIRYRLGELI